MTEKNVLNSGKRIPLTEGLPFEKQLHEVPGEAADTKDHTHQHLIQHSFQPLLRCCPHWVGEIHKLQLLRPLQLEIHLGPRLHQTDAPYETWKKEGNSMIWYPGTKKWWQRVVVPLWLAAAVAASVLRQDSMILEAGRQHFP